MIIRLKLFRIKYGLLPWITSDLKSSPKDCKGPGLGPDQD
jgi:hypothetical protein